MVSHANADPDAVASALLMHLALKHLGLDDVDVAFPEGPSRLSRKVLAGLNLDVRYLKAPPRRHYGAAVVVDATNFAQLTVFRRLVERLPLKLVVDHHVPQGDIVSGAAFSLVGNEPATVVLAYRVVRDLGLKLDPRLATLALSGLLFDSRRFAWTTPEALRAAASLVEEGGDYALALSLLEEETPFSERVARLKGALRSHVLRVGDFLVAASEVGSFEASVARSLVALGADAALVASEKGGECRLSVRLSKGFVERTGINAGLDVAAEVARSLGGRGGGHAAAGSYRGSCSASEALRAALTAITSKLTSKPRPLR